MYKTQNANQVVAETSGKSCPIISAQLGNKVYRLRTYLDQIDRERNGMYRIAICDPDRDTLKKTREGIDRYLADSMIRNVCIKEYEHPDQLIRDAEGSPFDICITEVEMPMIDGITLIKELRETNRLVLPVIVTKSRNHFEDAFDINVLHYIVKPIKQERIFEAMTRAFNLLPKRDRDTLTVKVGRNKIYVIDIGDIVYSETREGIQTIWLKDGRTVETRMTGEHFFDLVKHRQEFCRCGSAYTVNMDQICQLSMKSIYFVNGGSISVPRRVYPEFRQIFCWYKNIDGTTLE